MKKRLLPPLVAALALTAWPALANVSGKVVVNQAPPPPVTSSEDTAREQREGYVYAPGYWNWTGTKYEWTKGHYIPARKGYRYTAPRWVQEGEAWTLYPEQWVKNEDDREKTVSKDSSLPNIR